jgi:leucyl aminopeptidase
MFEIVSNLAKRPKADLIVVPLFKGKKGAELGCIIPDLRSDVDAILREGDFSAKVGSTMLAYLKGKKERRLLLVGLGPEEECTLEILRRAYAAFVKRCRKKKWRVINAILPKVKKIAEEEVQRAVSEGIGLTLYIFEEWKSKENQKPFYLEKIVLIGAKDKAISKKTEGILSGVTLARDLINQNALNVTPQFLANTAKDLAKEFASVKTTVWDKARIEKEKMGLFLAVASGSCCDPALIMVEYRGRPASSNRILVVGKGITFDTGGLNLKSTGNIEAMKDDMSGAAAALGIIKAAARIKLKANIAVVIAATENAIDARSYKPGDVYRSYLGKTVEITNTDAEGRLTLADALALGQKRFSPKWIIDIATLTGAIGIALGQMRAGLFTNDPTFASLCEEAGEMSGEKVWRLPMDADYKEYLKSDLADIKNSSTKKYAGSVTAAIFLQEFIQKGTPWIHLDIAATAYLDEPAHYHLTPATGIGVRLIIALLEKLHGK